MKGTLGVGLAAIGLMLAAPALAADGQEVYTKNCATCHNTLKPKIGDKAAWEPYIKEGEDAMVTAVVKGKGTMPHHGGHPALSDDEVKAAVEYIISKSQ